eukprot:1473277-Pyramimonas_sp.AAC.1
MKTRSKCFASSSHVSYAGIDLSVSFFFLPAGHHGVHGGEPQLRVKGLNFSLTSCSCSSVSP